MHAFSLFANKAFTKNCLLALLDTFDRSAKVKDKLPWLVRVNASTLKIC